MANLVLALDGIEHPPFIPFALIGGAWFASFATVSLAEEIWPDCL
jgi:apolipoprotein N-acyltransferase